MPKALIEIAGKPLFVHAADLLVRHPACIEAVIAAPAGFEADFAQAAKREWNDERVRVALGGATRQQSVLFALRSLRKSCDAVLVHDAARAFVTRDLIARVLEALSGQFVGTVPGLPVTDTIKRVLTGSGIVLGTMDRADLMAVQTPQAVLRTIAIDAFERAAVDGTAGTDDVSLVEYYRLGPVRVVKGDPRNFKITTPEDLARARVLLDYATQ